MLPPRFGLLGLAHDYCSRIHLLHLLPETQACIALALAASQHYVHTDNNPHLAQTCPAFDQANGCHRLCAVSVCCLVFPFPHTTLKYS